MCAWNPPFSDYEGKDYFGQTAAVVCLSTYAHTNTTLMKKKAAPHVENGGRENIPPPLCRQDRQAWGRQSIISHKKKEDSNNRGGSLFCPTIFLGGTLAPNRLPGESLLLLRLQEHFTAHLGRVLQSLPGKKFQKSKSLLLPLSLVFPLLLLFFAEFHGHSPLMGQEAPSFRRDPSIS